ncbi:MAG TPA: hypothetical protein VJ723_04545 [Candidatus Angelobacter sp.]|nr:hypothetical protein [Candidatus Angelobacter sp.]
MRQTKEILAFLRGLRLSLRGVFGIAVVFVTIQPGASKVKAGCADVPLYSGYASEMRATKSPDGKNLLTVDADGSHLSYVLKTDKKYFRIRMRGLRTEVLWSPDSSSFAVNQTEGGGGIGQRAYIFYLRGNRLQRVNVSLPVEKVFGAPVKCEVRVPPNTAVLQWLDSKSILMVAEIANVSVCKCRGTFRTYKISLPNLKVLESYTQSETKRLFPNALGCELRGADDVCAKSWQKK